MPPKRRAPDFGGRRPSINTQSTTTLSALQPQSNRGSYSARKSYRDPTPHQQGLRPLTGLHRPGTEVLRCA